MVQRVTARWDTMTKTTMATGDHDNGNGATGDKVFNEQTNERTNKRTNKQINKRTNKQTNEQIYGPGP